MKTRLLLTICFTVITICLPNCKPASVEPPRVEVIAPAITPNVQDGDILNVQLVMSSNLPMTDLSTRWVYGVNKVPCSAKTSYELDDIVAMEKELLVIVPEVSASIVEEHEVFLEIEVFSEESSKKEFVRVNYSLEVAAEEVLYSVEGSDTEVILRVCRMGADRKIYQKFNSTVANAAFNNGLVLLHTSDGLISLDSAGGVQSFDSEPVTDLLGVVTLGEPYLLYPELIVSVNSKMERTQSFSLPSNTKPFNLAESNGVLIAISNGLAGNVSLTKLNARSGLVLHHQVFQGRLFIAAIPENSNAFLLFEKASDGTAVVRFSSQNSMNTLTTLPYEIVDVYKTSTGVFIRTAQDELFAFDMSELKVNGLVLDNISSITRHPNDRALVALQHNGMVNRVTSNQVQQIAQTCNTKNAVFVGVN